MQNQIEKIRQIVEAVVNREQVELVDFQLKGRSGSQALKVFIYSETGVTLDKCSQVSRSLADELDIEDVIAEKYRLEVSSPGIARPLLTIRDFQRNLNREVEILLDEDTGGSFKGEIVSVSDETVSLQGGGATQTFLLSSIKQGKLSLPW